MSTTAAVLINERPLVESSMPKLEAMPERIPETQIPLSYDPKPTEDLLKVPPEVNLLAGLPPSEIESPKGTLDSELGVLVASGYDPSGLAYAQLRVEQLRDKNEHRIALEVNGPFETITLDELAQNLGKGILQARKLDRNRDLSTLVEIDLNLSIAEIFLRWIESHDQFHFRLRLKKGRPEKG